MYHLHVNKIGSILCMRIKINEYLMQDVLTKVFRIKRELKLVCVLFASSLYIPS